jgi:tetratricopeptide (TPR) repeat protein
MTYLKRQGLYDRMLIVFASDHGESLGEHGEKEHGFFVYHSTLHVPLLVKPPAASHVRPRRDGNPVPIMAIAPTILATLGLKDPIEKQFETTILLAEKSGASDPPVYSESFYSFSSFGWAPLRTINTSAYQYIEAPKPELYDLRNDPAETRNLIADQKATVSVLTQQLKDLVARYTPDDHSANTSQLSAEAVQKLRALGYMAYRSPVSAEALAAGLADPKDKIWDFNVVLGAVDAGKMGKADQQRELLAQVEARNPDMYLIPFLFGEAQLQASDWSSAEESLRRCLKLNPEFDQAMSALARALHQQKKDDEARQWVDKALQINPKNLKAWYQKGWMTMASDPAVAADAFEQTLAIQPSFAMAHRDLGMLMLQQQRFPEAASHLEKATELGIDQPRLYNFLGIAYSRAGRYRDAAGVYKKALAKDSSYAEAHLNLSYAYQKLNRPADAKAEYQIACKLDSKLCQYRPEQAR